MKQHGSTPLEKGISTLLAYSNQALGLITDTEEELPSGQIDIFSALVMSDYLKNIILVDNIEEFSKPILTKASIKEHISQIEEALGESKRNTKDIVLELTEDMQMATQYPPVIKEISNGTDIKNELDYLIKNLLLESK